MSSSDSAAAETSNSDYADGVPSPYLNSVRFLAEQYGIRRFGNTLMIGDVPITVHGKGDLSIGGRVSKVRGVFGNSSHAKSQ